MEREYNNIPNVLPKGVLEPIDNDDLIIAKIKFEAKQNYQGTNNMIDRGKKHEHGDKARK